MSPNEPAVDAFETRQTVFPGPSSTTCSSQWPETPHPFWPFTLVASLKPSKSVKVSWSASSGAASA